MQVKDIYSIFEFFYAANLAIAFGIEKYQIGLAGPYMLIYIKLRKNVYELKKKMFSKFV